MPEAPLLSPTLIPEVVMPFMNAVHHEELELVNELLGLIAGAGDNDAVGEKLGAWLDHTIAHFAREEHYMQEYQFPPYPVHAGEHQSALQQFETLIQQWNEQHDRAALNRFIHESWVPWLQNHISTMDFVTAQFLSQFDIKVEL